MRLCGVDAVDCPLCWWDGEQGCVNSGAGGSGVVHVEVAAEEGYEELGAL